MTRYRRVPYSAAELQWLEDNRLMMHREYHREFCAKFNRPDVTAANLKVLRGRLGLRSCCGAAWNKGTGKGGDFLGAAGYTMMNVPAATRGARRSIYKHRWLWEKSSGPIPEGMVLKCKGDKANPDPTNWELVPRTLLPRLNGNSGRNYDTAPAELKPAIMAIAKLEYQLRERAGKRDRQVSNSQRAASPAAQESTK